MLNNSIAKIKEIAILSKYITKLKGFYSSLDRDIQRIIFVGGSLLLIIILGYTLKSIFTPNPIEDIKFPKYNVVTTYKGAGKEALVRPLGVAVDSSGYVYVADSSHHRIVVFSVEGKVERIIGEPGTHAGQLNYPTSVAVYNEKLYVADSSNGRIVTFSKHGDYINQINNLTDEKNKDKSSLSPKNNNPNNLAFKPISITIDSQGYLYVTDGLGHQVLVFNQSGKLVKNFGSPGVREGQFAYPNGIALDEKKKRIFVSDFANNRIQVFSWDGKFKYQFADNELFLNPRGLAYNSDDDRLYVADIFNHRITVLNGKGQFLGYFGEIGSSNGKFHFPNGLFIYRHNLYITDRENHRVVLVKIN